MPKIVEGWDRFFIRLFEQHALDALLITGLADIRYLTGFSGTDAAVIVQPDGLVFMSDSRYTAQAQQQVQADQRHQYRQKVEGISRFLGDQPKRVGFVASQMTVDFYQKLQQSCEASIEWVALEDGLTSLRMIKTAQEIELLEVTATLHREAFDAVMPLLKPGTKEKDISLALEFELKRRGGEEKAFDFIVASGTRGALPHGVASDKCLAAGELVTIDFGTRINGYHSDETITVGVGDVPDPLLQLHAIVLEAQRRAKRAVAPGIPLKELDGIARDYIAECGYAEHFGHGLGHGVGLEIHESPVVSQRSEVIAQKNMVFTVEPGIYIENFGGVRIEDTIVVTADGYKDITVLGKDYRSFH